MTYRKIRGQLFDAQTRQNLSGIRIEAFYKLGNQLLLSQSVVSGEDGQFTLEYGPDLFANLSPDDSISVNFEVCQDNRRLVSNGRIDRLARKNVKVEILVQPAPKEPVKEDGKKKVPTPADFKTVAAV